MYRADITNNGGYTFKVESKGYVFNVDMHGKAGVTPPDTLLASLGSCIGVYIRKYAEGTKLVLPEFSVVVEADFSKGPPVCFKNMNVTVDLKGVKLDERRYGAMINFIKNCPVHNTLKNNPDINIKIDGH